MRTGMAELKDERLAGIVSDAVTRLVAAYRPERIYLFGSTARGDAGPDSDCDLMVVLADQNGVQGRRARTGYEALRGVAVPVELQVMTAREFDRQLRFRASLPSTIVREGRLIYRAGC